MRTSFVLLVAAGALAACNPSVGPDGALTNHPGTSLDTPPEARTQTGDVPAGQWMLATEGCGLDAIVREAEAAAADEYPRDDDPYGGGYSGGADAAASSDAAGDYYESWDTGYEPDPDTDTGWVDPCADAGDSDVDRDAECPDAGGGPGVDAGPEVGVDKLGGDGENPWEDASADPLATFSSDVDTASYTRARATLRGGGLPDPTGVRVEDFVNYFRYPYPAPLLGDGDPFFVTVEVAPTPFAPDGTSTLRVAIQGAVAETCERPPANLVFLLDVSGSMSMSGKLDLAKYAIMELAENLNADDTVAIVTYAGAVAEILPPTPATEHATIRSIVSALDAGGSTWGEGGLALAYQVARRAFIPGGINRVILATDGDFNVGLTGQDLVDRIVAERDAGITLSALGFGTTGYNDVQLNEISDHGNGNYVFVDSEAEADRLVNDMLMATLLMLGRDLKIQVEFDPRYVARYRVVGYDTRELADDEFAADHVDAGDVGAGHAVTALIEVEWNRSEMVLAGSMADGAALGVVNVRYKPAFQSDVSVLLQRRILGAHVRSAFEDASESFRLAAAMAEFAELLRGSAHAEDGDFDAVVDAIEGVTVGGDARAEAVELVRLAAALSH